MTYTDRMKSLLALSIPAAGVLAALGALETSMPLAMLMIVMAIAGFWRFVLH